MVAVDPKYLKKIKGREFVVFEGLLDLAHQEGLNLIETELVQHPNEDNGQVAIAHAKIRTDRGTFSGIGDAHPGNVKEHIAPHLIRMAETRAIVRALRWATNVGQAAIEELGEIGEAETEGAHPTDEQLEKLGELMKNPALPLDDLEAVEEALPQISQRQADDLITILEAKLEALQAPRKPTPPRNGHTMVSQEEDLEVALEGEDEGEPATLKQVGLIRNTVEEHRALLTEKEASYFHALLSGSLSKEKASTLLDFLLGKSVKHPLTGAWQKVTQGIIAQRRTTGKAA